MTDMESRGFLVQLPVWFVLDAESTAVDEAAGTARAEEELAYVTIGSEGSMCAAAFTDEDLARRFVEEAGVDGIVAGVESPGEFLSLLTIFSQQCPYVAFDPPGRVGTRARWVMPTEQVMEAVRRRMEE